jgi:phenylacetate-CoA ligase
LFLVSPYEQAAWAGTILARTLPSLRRGGYRIAFFLRSSSNLYESLDGRWLRLRYYDLMLPLAEMVAALNAQPPDFLVGPPSLLGLLADACSAGKLRIRPERLYSVAEVLEPQDRQRLAAAFAAPVHEIYQCTEGLLAISCPQGSLHIQEDIVALQLEPLTHGPDGPRFTPVVTDLWRTTQPIIRYRLNDVLTLDPRRCNCGSAFRILARIEGRCDDICYFVDTDDTQRPFFADTVRRMILLAGSAIRDYQVFQDRTGSLRIHLELEPGEPFAPTAQCVAASVENTVRGYGCRLQAVQVEPGLVPQLPHQKRRRVQRLG